MTASQRHRTFREHDLNSYCRAVLVLVQSRYIPREHVYLLDPKALLELPPMATRVNLPLFLFDVPARLFFALSPNAPLLSNL